MRRIILVDDEPNVLTSLHRLLKRHSPYGEIHIELCSSPIEALKLARLAVYDVVITDYNMPQLNGVDFLSKWKQIQADSVRIILTASSDFGQVQDAINKVNIFKYILKPWSDESFLETIGDALRRHDETIDKKNMALFNKQYSGKLSPIDMEIQRLEELEPGITKVQWDIDGSVLLDDI